MGVQALFATLPPPCDWTNVTAMVMALNAPLTQPKLEEHLQRIPATVYITADHHRHHASYAFYTSPFRTAAVLTLEGAGADGHHVALWSAARATGTLELLWTCPNCWVRPLHVRLDRDYSITGEEVARAAVLVPPDESYFRLVSDALIANWGPNVLTEGNRISAFLQNHRPHTAARLSALQRAVESLLVSKLQPFKAVLGGLQGLVLGGGTATSTVLPHALGAALALPVWVPAAPGDATLGFGALWALRPPPGRPAPQFADRGGAAWDPGGLACVALSAPELSRALREQTGVAVMGRTDAIDAAMRKRPWFGIGTPGRRTLVGCAPLPRDRATLSGDDPHVLMESVRVADIFHTAVPVFSPAHAFRLRARASFHMILNASAAVVAAVERGQDSTIDGLLDAAQHCDAPLLFCRTLWGKDVSALLRGGGLRHVLWEGQLCTARRR